MGKYFVNKILTFKLRLISFFNFLLNTLFCVSILPACVRCIMYKVPAEVRKRNKSSGIRDGCESLCVYLELNRVHCKRSQCCCREHSQPVLSHLSSPWTISSIMDLESSSRWIFLKCLSSSKDLFMWLSLCSWVSTEMRRRPQNFWSWRYSLLQAIWLGAGNWPWASTKAVGALRPWASSLASMFLRSFLKVAQDLEIDILLAWTGWVTLICHPHHWGWWMFGSA